MRVTVLKPNLMLRLLQNSHKAFQCWRIKLVLSSDSASVDQLHPLCRLLLGYAATVAIYIQCRNQQAMLHSEGLPRQTAPLKLQDKPISLNPVSAMKLSYPNRFAPENCPSQTKADEQVCLPRRICSITVAAKNDNRFPCL
jgi:hypothetical protein